MNNAIYKFDSENIVENVSTLLKDKQIYEFINTANWDYCLTFEAAFVIVTAIQDRSLLINNAEYTEELVHTLQYPKDDVSFCLRLYYFWKEASDNNDFKTFENFTLRHQIDRKLFNKINAIASRISERFSNPNVFSKPVLISSRIDAVGLAFVAVFGKHPCVYSGSEQTKFYDFQNNQFFRISNSSILYNSISLRMGKRHAVYYMLYKTDWRNNESDCYANFLCIIPYRLAVEKKFYKILFDEESFNVGRLMSRRLLRIDPEFVRRKCEDNSIMFYDYQVSRGKLIVICSSTSIGKIHNFIDNQIREFLNLLRNRAGRSFYLNEFKIMVKLGPGMQIMDIHYPNDESNILEITRKDNRKFKNSECEDISLKVVERDKEVTFFKDENNMKFFATLRSKFEAVQLKDLLVPLFKDYHILFYHTEWSDVFRFNNNKFINNLVLYEGSFCSVCLTRPDPLNFLRLAICGHLFCDACFLNCIKFSERFPIRCVVERCNGLVLFEDMDEVFTRSNLKCCEKQNAFLLPIVKKSLSYFLAENNHGFRRCMADNCHSILIGKLTLLAIRNFASEYKLECNTMKSEVREVLTRIGVHCFGCNTQRCGLCGFGLHKDISCQEYYARNHIFNNEGLLTWKKENPEKRRFCPNNDCHVLIEKSEGCNHMECPMCKIHFCWLCPDYRSKTCGEIHAHMQREHGGIGLPDFVDINF